jgi:hypothetical protein
MTDREALEERIVLALLPRELFHVLEVLPPQAHDDRADLNQRYQELKRTLPYLEASVRARREWLRDLLDAEPGADPALGCTPAPGPPGTA